MAIGGALAEARSEAGLTVTEVSARTRIRATIIRDIERDDYSSCGGDFYARGHIRAIARVVGTDPVPLIEEYDAARLPPPELADVTGPVQAVGPGRAGPRNERPADGGAVGGGAANRAGLAFGDSGAGAGGRRPTGPQPTGLGSRPGGITAAEAFRPSMPLQVPGRPVSRLTIVIALALVAAIGVLVYLLVAGPAGKSVNPRHTGAPVGPTTAAHHRKTAAPKPAGATPTTAAKAAVPLTPVSAMAFGPDGAGQGDNPARSAFAIDGSTSTDWQTDWYSAANFAGLQQGTGLLLDMGRRVSVSTVRLLLGTAPGGAFQLRAGDSPQLGGLPVIAEASDTGGSVVVTVGKPVPARYLLIWFTSLPPDSSGTYQADLYNVTVTGTP